MKEYIRVSDNIENDNIESDFQTELTEKIVNGFKIAIDFYRMEYSEDLRTLFNEFGYLLLCRLSYEGYLTDIPTADGRIHAHRRDVRLKEDGESELSAKEIDLLIGLLHSEFQRKVLLTGDNSTGVSSDIRFSVFADFSLSIKKHSVLRQLLLVIKDLLSLREQSEDMGAVYDAVYRIHSLCSNSSKADAGRFSLPDNIMEGLIKWLHQEVESGRMVRPVTVFDPQYGTGNMLTVAKQWYWDTDLFGFENNRTFRISAQILAILSHTVIKTYDGDFLEDRLENQYDMVLANPVFNNDGIPMNAYLQTLPNELKEIKRQYSLFIVRVLQAVAPDGYAVIITPDSFLFSSKREYENVRGWMLNNYSLEAVISLPEKIFYPRAVTKASALIVGNRFKSGGKMAYEQTKEVSFYQMTKKAERDSDTDAEARENWKPDNCWHVEINKIREAGWNLLPEYYRPREIRELRFEDPAVLLAELVKEQQDVLTDMENLLEEVKNIQ